ncbi:unnamed protein product [Closterium sp. NIES-65]|nr:unnamed protein product [Closterium sp. NIES-65]
MDPTEEHTAFSAPPALPSAFASAMQIQDPFLASAPVGSDPLVAGLAVAATGPSLPEAHLHSSSGLFSLPAAFPFADKALSSPGLLAVLDEPASPLQAHCPMAVAPHASLECTAESNLARSLTSSRCRRARLNPQLQPHEEIEKLPETRGRGEIVGSRETGDMEKKDGVLAGERGRARGLPVDEATMLLQEQQPEVHEEEPKVVTHLRTQQKREEQEERHQQQELQRQQQQQQQQQEEEQQQQQSSLLPGSKMAGIGGLWRPGWLGGSPKVMDYECRFCGKGFDSPRALGGHMNLHRKERKLEDEFLQEAEAQARPPMGPSTHSNPSPPQHPRLPSPSTDPFLSTLSPEVLQSLFLRSCPPETAAADPVTPRAVTAAASFAPAHPASVPPSLAPLPAAAVPPVTMPFTLPLVTVPPVATFSQHRSHLAPPVPTSQLEAIPPELSAARQLDLQQQQQQQEEEEEELLSQLLALTEQQAQPGTGGVLEQQGKAEQQQGRSSQAKAHVAALNPGQGRFGGGGGVGGVGGGKGSVQDLTALDWLPAASHLQGLSLPSVTVPDVTFPDVTMAGVTSGPLASAIASALAAVTPSAFIPSLAKPSLVAPSLVTPLLTPSLVRPPPDLAASAVSTPAATAHLVTPQQQQPWTTGFALGSQQQPQQPLSSRPVMRQQQQVGALPGRPLQGGGAGRSEDEELAQLEQLRQLLLLQEQLIRDQPGKEGLQLKRQGLVGMKGGDWCGDLSQQVEREVVAEREGQCRSEE